MNFKFIQRLHHHRQLTYYVRYPSDSWQPIHSVSPLWIAFWFVMARRLYSWHGKTSINCWGRLLGRTLYRRHFRVASGLTYSFFSILSATVFAFWWERPFDHWFDIRNQSYCRLGPSCSLLACREANPVSILAFDEGFSFRRFRSCSPSTYQCNVQLGPGSRSLWQRETRSLLAWTDQSWSIQRIADFVWPIWNWDRLVILQQVGHTLELASWR